MLPWGDKKSRSEVQAKHKESSEKVVLLKKALQKYQGLYVGGFGEEEDEALSSGTDGKTPKFGFGSRRPITGRLQVRVLSARQIAHAPRKYGKSLETHVTIKIDGVVRGKSRPSRNDRWNEQYDIKAENATELEITLSDRSGEVLVPVGLLWIRLSDIADEIRKRRMEREQGANGWAPARSAGIDAHTNLHPSFDRPSPNHFRSQSASNALGADVPGRRSTDQAPTGPSSSGAASASTSAANVQRGASSKNARLSWSFSGVVAEESVASTDDAKFTKDSLEFWWDVEPVGQIGLRLFFSKLK